MKIQIFEVIKQGISLSFKDKTVLGLIVLYSILWIISTVLIINPLIEQMIKQIGLDEVAYPPALTLPALRLDEILTIFALSIVSAFLFLAIAKAVFENLNKREISVSDVIISVLKKIIPILIANIIYSIIIIIGSIALIIPGIFLGVALFFCSHAILLDNKGIIASFKESYNIVKGNWWQIFALYLIFIIVFILGGALSGIFLVLVPFISIIIDFVFYFITGIMMIAYTIVYFQLIEKERKIDEAVIVAGEAI